MLGSQQHPVVLPQGEALHPPVFQGVAAQDLHDLRPGDPQAAAGGVGRQDVVGVVDAAESKLHREFPVDGEDAGVQVGGGDGEVGLGLPVAALRAAVGADLVIVNVVVGHGGVAEGAVGPVVIDAGGGAGGEGGLVHAEPLYLLMPLGEAGGEGVVGVQNQLRLGVDGGQNRLIDALRMAVAGELVPVEVGDDELRGVEVAEGVAGVALVALEKQHIRLDLAAQGGVGQEQGGDALHLVGALGVVDDGLPLRAEDGGDHLHRGGLSVGAGDGHDVGRQGQPCQDVRADLQCRLAGHGAALADEPAHGPAQLADDDGEKLSHGNHLLFK